MVAGGMVAVVSRPLVCDNVTCETEISAVDVDQLLEALHERDNAAQVPRGWVVVSEVDEEGDDVVLGECCSRACAAALLTMEVADAGVS